MYSKLIQLFIYAHSFLIYSFPLWFIVGYWIQFSVFYSRTFLFIHSIYTSLYLLIPTSHFIYTPKPSPWQPPGCSLCPCFCFCFINRLCHISGFTCKWYHMAFVFLWLASLHMIISSCSHIAANGIVLLFLMTE